jgi:hypothetical protein
VTNSGNTTGFDGVAAVRLPVSFPGLVCVRPRPAKASENKKTIATTLFVAFTFFIAFLFRACSEKNACGGEGVSFVCEHDKATRRLAPLQVIPACHPLETLRQEQCQGSSSVIKEREECFLKMTK